MPNRTDSTRTAAARRRTLERRTARMLKGLQTGAITLPSQTGARTR